MSFIETPWCKSRYNCDVCINNTEISKNIRDKHSFTCPINCRQGQGCLPIIKKPMTEEELEKEVELGNIELDKALHIANLLNLDLDDNKVTMPEDTVAITSIAAKLFPGVWQDCLYYHSTISQKLIVRVDMNYSDDEDIAWIKTNFPHAVIRCSEIVWNRWNWREELIRSLDDIQPKYVIFLDQDETFDTGFEVEFNEFAASEYDYMMFKFSNPSDKPIEKKVFPAARHMKAFKWKEGLTYNPYQGYAKINGLSNPMGTKTKVCHWCYWNDYLRDTKEEHR